MREHDETRDRFLAAIADALDAAVVEEAHLFPPIKQGGTESGVAVIAVREAVNPETVISSEARDDRLVVYTAKYRLTLKGPERGKWEFTVHAEADAPLVTVDKVVRGVQRRSGDAEDAARLSGEEFRALVPARPSAPAEGPSV